MKEDFLFGRIAALNNIITEEQLAEACETQKRSSTLRTLGGILLEQGYINQIQFKAILQAQKKRLPRPVKSAEERKEDMAFGYLAVKNLFLTVEEVVKCLKFQLRVSKKGLLFRLAEILVTNGYLTHNEVLEIFDIQDKKILSCENCSTRYNTIGLRPNVSFACSKCGNSIVVPIEVCGQNEAEELLQFREDVESCAQMDGQSIAYPETEEFLRIIEEEDFSYLSQDVVESKDENLLDVHFAKDMLKDEDEIDDGEISFITLGKNPQTLDSVGLGHNAGENTKVLGVNRCSNEDLLDEDLLDEDMIAIGPELVSQSQSKKIDDEEAYIGLEQVKSHTKDTTIGTSSETSNEGPNEEDMLGEDMIAIGPQTLKNAKPK